ncbi:MAG TPA: GAF domain-containing protein [Verrucomicrobiales bacterium]|nr:GAF domain-containing protein [Verrucomicrobiales bacterium]
MKAPLPCDEEERLSALRRYDVLDTEPEQELDDITLLASRICGTPIAMISLVDENRQWFKSKVGVSGSETSRDIAFCAHGILQAEVFVIKDAQADQRFSENPLVTENPRIRFYAGAPLISPDGHALGMLCVNDQVPRELSAEQMEALQALSRQVVAQFEARRNLAELQETFDRLKLAEKSLRESDEKFRQLAGNITDVFWMTSADKRRMHYVSPAYERIWGRSMESLRTDPGQWVEAILPEERERVFAAFSCLGADAASVSVEYRISRPDGSIRWIHDRGFVVRDAEGKVIRHTGIASDITERKRTEQQGKLQNAINCVLAESSTMREASTGILRTICEDLKWDAGIFWNLDRRAGAMQFDDAWTAPEIQADEFVRVCRQRTFARGEGLPGRVWEGGEAVWIPDIAKEAGFRRADAAEGAGLRGALSVPVLVANEVRGVMEFFCRGIRPPDKELLGMFAVLSAQLGQFFERKRLEEHLIHSQKMDTVGKLAGGVAHEFNSIMTTIIGQSELLLSDLPPGSPLCENAGEIRKAAGVAATLTRQLLAYGRKQFLQAEMLDLNTILTGMETTLRHLAGRNTDVRIIPFAGLNAVRADAGQIEQVILNMTMNAADAMPRGGKLTLETANVTLDGEYVSADPELKAGEYVMVAITDSGMGMSEEVKARLFEPFFTTKGVGQGTGLGLSSCEGIIKQSGGHIGVYSEQGRGTTFRIYLPRVEAVSKPEAQAPAAPKTRYGSESILLVEDDTALREMATNLLRRLGYTVYPAANGIEALKLRERHDTGPVQLLLTDVVMPLMDGKELADRIRALYPGIRVLFTSAYTGNAIAHQGMLNEGESLLPKPFTPSALAGKLREVLDGGPAAPEAPNIKHQAPEKLQAPNINGAVSG